MCDHLHSPALTSQGSYVTASGVSRKCGGGQGVWGGGNRLITAAEDAEPQGVLQLFASVDRNGCDREAVTYFRTGEILTQTLIFFGADRIQKKDLPGKGSQVPAVHASAFCTALAQLRLGDSARQWE